MAWTSREHIVCVYLMYCLTIVDARCVILLLLGLIVAARNRGCCYDALPLTCVCTMQFDFV